MRATILALALLAACGKEKAPLSCDDGQYLEAYRDGTAIKWRCKDACPKGQRVAYAPDGTNLGCEAPP